MIGSGLKKFAEANGLTVKNGVAYGTYDGVFLTLQEGAGWKSVSAAVYFDTAEQSDRVRGWLGDEARQKEFRIQGGSVTDVSVKPGSVQVAFTDNPGTMGKIEAFLPLFTAMLKDLAVKSTQVCHSCGMAGGDAADVLIGSTVYHLHDSCSAKAEAELREEADERKSTGSVAKGAIGAVLGAIIGAIPWVIVYAMGYIASLLGLLIGICAKKGYELAKGKETKAKGIVIVICVLLAVVVAEFAAIVAVNTADGIELGWTFGEIVAFMLEWAMGEGLAVVLKEIALGWLFALLGIFQLLRVTFRQTKVEKVVRL